MQIFQLNCSPKPSILTHPPQLYCRLMSVCGLEYEIGLPFRENRKWGSLGKSAPDRLQWNQ